MNNIDEDINRCKELVKEEHSNWIGLTNQEAISKVLSELETKQKDEENWKKIYEEQEESIIEKNNKICDLEFKVDDLKSELETYKKIAEKLESMVLDMSHYYDTFNDGELIKLVRKEVENEK